MKTLKFNHGFAQQILKGEKTSTWRLYDDKDLSVNDTIKIIDQVNPDDPSSWRVIGTAKVKEIVEKNLGDVTKQDMRGHEFFESDEDMLNRYRGYYGDRVSLETPVKIINFDFRLALDETATPAMLLEKARIYTDGGSRGNPGDSACAFIICKMDEIVVEKSGYYMGTATNNQAEYYGMIKGLERARDLGIDKVDLMSDSQLVVNQMNGFYKVKNQELAPLHHQLKELSDSFEHISFTHVPRELNKIADKEVNRILDAHEKHRHKRF
ncbi:MAG TPA: reverse transcriptase-like protein [Candidatus Saccharimonadales bacterium]|nr:reverse transcriptase-like protein [Candidatus Saccharimonadales bacterium]